MEPQSAVAFSSIETEVSRHVERLLGESIARDEPLMEAGLDSLGAVELRTELSKAYAIELSSTLTFDHPSIAAVTKHLAGLIGTISKV